MIKYSKSFNDIIALKKSFFEENEKKLNSIKKINSFYTEQPLREKCKNCLHEIGNVDFVSFGVGYSLCDNCGHLNGMHEDTQFFVEKIYTDSEFKYYENYIENPQSYLKKVDNVFIPKLNFLEEVLKTAGENRISICDLGCGAGHSVYAANLKNFDVKGYEVSKKMCDLGNSKLEENMIFNVDIDEIYNVVLHTECNVVSLYGVLEHLCRPHEFLTNFNLSKAEYLYINVPLFSVSTFVENVFKNVMPRQLSGAHTHLWTEESLRFLFKKYNLDVIGEWWFGTDSMDIYRSILIELQNNNVSEKLIKKYNDFYQNLIDHNQARIDQDKNCSEVHFILKKGKK